MQDEMGSISVEEFVRLTSKMYSILVSHSSEYKKAKVVNKNIVAKISYKNYNIFF